MYRLPWKKIPARRKLSSEDFTVTSDNAGRNIKIVADTCRKEENNPHASHNFLLQCQCNITLNLLIKPVWNSTSIK
eukprot:Gb_08927 [translate_table: standard]